MTDWYLLVLTVCVYVLSLLIHKYSPYKALCNPLLISFIVILSLIYQFDLRLEEYVKANWLLDWVLGPATIALAVPMYNQLSRLNRGGITVVLSIVVGGAIAAISAFTIMYLADLPMDLTLTSLTKSITTPLATEVSESIGGLGTIAALYVSATGIIGLMLYPIIVRLFKDSSEEVHGMALGTVAHAIGTAHAVQQSQVKGGYASLALCINGIITACILTLLFWFL